MKRDGNGDRCRTELLWPGQDHPNSFSPRPKLDRLRAVAVGGGFGCKWSVAACWRSPGCISRGKGRSNGLDWRARGGQEGGRKHSPNFGWNWVRG
jgi:hypothetical protein